VTFKAHAPSSAQVLARIHHGCTFLMQNVHIFYLLPYCIHIVAQFVMLEGNSVTPKISKDIQRAGTPGMWR
jgi:hypothetical protein